jgi:gluconolactonase
VGCGEGKKIDLGDASGVAGAGGGGGNIGQQPGGSFGSEAPGGAGGGTNGVRDAQSRAEASGGGASTAGRDARSGLIDASNVDAPKVDARSPDACPSGPFPTPVVGSSTPVCMGFQFNNPYNEGPTWIAAQSAFYFSNFVQGQAMPGDFVKYTPGAGCEIFISGVGCNGLAVAPDGNLLAACQQSRSVIEFDVVSKQATTLTASYMNQMLDTPNDLIAHTNGSVYFTNPTYELGGRPEGVGPAVFWRDPGGKLTAIAKGGAPNGIALSPDEKKLYVVGAGQWDISPDGVPSNEQDTFVSGDGIAVDCAGNVYSSTGTIRSSRGLDLGTFQGGTNLTFGGPDGKTLLVVGGGTNVRTMVVNLPGLP